MTEVVRMFRKAGFALLLVLTSLICLAVYLLTLGRFRNGLRRWVVKPATRLGLRILGVELEVIGNPQSVASPCFYTANHTSSLDVLVVAALGLPSARFFMSRSTLSVVPVTLINLSLGTFFLSEQTEPQKRVREFMRATKILRSTGESAFLNPEGARIRTGTIGRFNRATFHMAAVLKRPIVPLFFEVSRDADPGMGLIPKGGKVKVHVLDVVQTHDWQLSDINARARDLRHVYLNFQRLLTTTS